jgi:hypothetical protein
MRPALFSIVVAALALAGCGSSASGGRYRIAFNALSNDADQQRQTLVRLLAAKSSTIDIAGMDVAWTAEFASAGWILPWPERYAAAVRRGTLAGPLKTATYRGRLWAAPANTNTQLLWYRKDLVRKPARTWDGLVARRRSCRARAGSRSRARSTRASWSGSTHSCSRRAARSSRATRSRSARPAGRRPRS